MSFDIGVFERAVELMARQLMRFREGDAGWDGEPTENDRLMAGHLAGSLAGNDLLVSRLPDTEGVRDLTKEASK